MTEGKKFDHGKPRMELLPTEALEQIAKVLAFGAKKYGDYNWRAGMDWSRLIGAALRHLTAFNNGIDNDEETGISHLAHASCCLMFLLEYQKSHQDKDNRFKSDENANQYIVPAQMTASQAAQMAGIISWSEEEYNNRAIKNRAP